MWTEQSRAQPALLLRGLGGSTSRRQELPCPPGSILQLLLAGDVHPCRDGTDVPTPAPLAPAELVPKALKPRLLCIAAAAGSGWQLQHGHRDCPQLLAAPSCTLPKGSSPARRGCGSNSSKPFASVQEGEQGHSGKPPTAWMERGADGRTNSAGISVSYNLSPRSLPRLTFSSHGAGLRLEKETRKPGRVSEWQVFCSEHQGQYTRAQMIFRLFKNRHRQHLCCFVPFSKEFMSNYFSFFYMR